MNSVLEAPKDLLQKPAYPEMNRHKRPSQRLTKLKPNHRGKQVVMEFFGLLLAGILLGRLCVMLERSTDPVRNSPPNNFVAVLYQWSGFHRTAVR